jgi:hypothetical protein
MALAMAMALALAMAMALALAMAMALAMALALALAMALAMAMALALAMAMALALAMAMALAMANNRERMNMTDQPKLPLYRVRNNCCGGINIRSAVVRENAIADRLHEYYEKLTALGINEVNLIAIGIWNTEQELRGNK